MCIELGFIDVGLIFIMYVVGVSVSEVASLAFKDYMKARRGKG